MQKITRFIIFFFFLILIKGTTYSQFTKDIFDAVDSYDITKIKQLISKDHSIINYMDPTRGTPLHFAIRRGSDKVVQLLLSNGSDVNAKDFYGLTPIYDAIKEGSLDFVKLLISKKARLDVKSNDGNTPLHHAVIAGNPEIVKYLILKGSNINSINNESKSPLHLAAIDNNYPIIEILISKGAKINQFDKFGNTPLHYAGSVAKKDNCMIFDKLLENEADLYAKNSKTGLRPRDLINVEEVPDKQSKYNYTKLHEAVYDNDISLVNTTLSGMNNLDEQDCMGNTALHIASMHGYGKLVETLLLKGSGLYLKNKNDKTVLDLAKDNPTKQLILRYEKSQEFKLNQKVKELDNLVVKLGNKEIQIAGLKTKFLSDINKYRTQRNELKAQYGINNDYEKAKEYNDLTNILRLIQENDAYVQYLDIEKSSIIKDIDNLKYYINKAKNEIDLVKVLGEDKLKELIAEINKAIETYEPRTGEIILDTKGIKKIALPECLTR